MYKETLVHTLVYQLSPSSVSHLLTLAQKLPSNLRVETICFAAVLLLDEIDECLHSGACACSTPRKIDLNKKWLPKQKTIQNFNIDAQGFRKTRNENPPMQEIGVTS